MSEAILRSGISVMSFAAVAVMFIAGALIHFRMRSRHPTTQAELGAKDLFGNSISASFKSARFFILSNAYKQFEDPVLNIYVLAARGSVATFAVLALATWILNGLHAP